MKTIIFDFDGTIADSFKVLIEITHQLTGHESLINPIEVKQLKRESMVEAAEQLNVPKYMWPILVFRGRRMMAKRLNEIKPFEGIDEVLSSLHGQGYRIYIMSSNSTKNISKFLSSNGLRSYVQKIYGGVGLLSKSGALRKILKRRRFKSGDVIYVGDEVRDIEAAKNVDIPIIAVSWGFNDVDRLKEEMPTAVVGNRPHLLKELQFWAKVA